MDLEEHVPIYSDHDLAEDNDDMVLEDGDVNYAEMEPEYDMEFSQFAHNHIELPMSPPRTPSPGPAPRRRDPSPFSDATSMTSVSSVETVGMCFIYRVYAHLTSRLIGYYREEAGRMFPAVVRNTHHHYGRDLRLIQVGKRSISSAS